MYVAQAKSKIYNRMVRNFRNNANFVKSDNNIQPYNQQIKKTSPIIQARRNLQYD